MIAAMAVLLVLVLAASHAEATCAWVLWSKVIELHERGVGGSGAFTLEKWRVETAIPTYEGCRPVAESRTASARAKGSWKTPEGVLITTSYLCLPDTVDPRPKR